MECRQAYVRAPFRLESSIDAPSSYVAASSQWSSYHTVAGFIVGRVIVAPQRRIDVGFIAIARFT